MTVLALGLVLAAAVVHASWNFLAKRAGGTGMPFVWLFGACATLLYLPVAIAVFATESPAQPVRWIVPLAGSACLHLAYFLVLQHGYGLGDLSTVYPVARGTGPMLASAAAVAFLGERPSGRALFGGAVICAGVLLVGLRGGGALRSSRVSLAYGLATGVLIACYTVWDRRGVAVVGVPPIILDWGSNFGRTVLLSPLAFRHRSQVADVWRSHRREVLGVALLSPIAYILVLAALTFTGVTYVAPAREVSIVFATLLAVAKLGERVDGSRLAGIAAILGGLVLLATG